MRNIDRVFGSLTSIFFALRELPSDCPDDELVKAIAGLTGYAKLALNRAVELVTSKDD